jgi:small subunit ribosomal protein S3Ae
MKQKIKKKKWCAIYAPALFGNQFIGETLIEDAQQLKGKFVSANLSTITNDMKKQNIMMTFRVNKVEEGKGQAEIIGMTIVQGFVKRLVRRGRTKIDDSFLVKSKDGQAIRIKPLIITNTECVRSTTSQIRMEARRVLSDKIARNGFVNVVQDILNFRIQKDLKERLNKIHPIKSVDIRVFSRETVRGQVPEADLQLVEEDPEAIRQEEPSEKEDAVEEDDEESAEGSAESTPVEKESEDDDAEEEK